MGGRIPADRTIKQPAAGFCRNPECSEENGEFHFVVEHDHFVCPKCKADRAPMIGSLVLTHLMIRNEAGPILGEGGLRYALGCDMKRAYLATMTNEEAATDNPKVANCPGCLERAESLGIKTNMGWVLQLDSPG